MSKKGLVELLKSIGRAIWFSVLALVVTFLTSILTPDLLAIVWTLPYVNIALPVGVWIYGGILAVIKAIDLYRHNSTKTKSNGIALPFLQK